MSRKKRYSFARFERAKFKRDTHKVDPEEPILLRRQAAISPRTVVDSVERSPPASKRGPAKRTPTGKRTPTATQSPKRRPVSRSATRRRSVSRSATRSRSASRSATRRRRSGSATRRPMTSTTKRRSRGKTYHGLGAVRTTTSLVKQTKSGRLSARAAYSAGGRDGDIHCYTDGTCKRLRVLPNGSPRWV